MRRSPASTTSSRRRSERGSSTSSRRGSGLRALLDVYAHCDAHGLRMYGGGMGEVGIARGQIQLLAALFHPDEPNDVAPSAYNLPDLADGLPRVRSCRAPRRRASGGASRLCHREPLWLDMASF
jgi:hypothetical protein